MHKEISYHFCLYFLKFASSTLKADSLVGEGLVPPLTTSPPMVITLQLATEDSLPINREIGGLEDTRTDPRHPQHPEQFKGTDPKELSLLLVLP